MQRRGKGGVHFVLLLPSMDVVRFAPPAYIDEFAGLDEHFARRDNIDERGLGGVLVSEPYGNWDVVRGAAILDWEQAMCTKQQLGPAVIVCLCACQNGRQGQRTWVVLYTSVFGRRVG